MTSPINAAAQSAAADSTVRPAANASSLAALSQKDTFLKLLVAQIKNQNPMNPTDGIQFVSQLAQFSELEQIMQIRDGIDGLRGDLKAKETPPADSTGSSTTGV